MDEINYQKLLTTRICDLELDIEESMKPYLDSLKQELENRSIKLWPDFYFGDEWGCFDKTISVAIPFYFAKEELKTIEQSLITHKELLKILRHETGHAVNYAYKLWKRKDWREMFGNFNKRYSDRYMHKVNPWSKEYVKHLHYIEDPHYAQKHPDEDWAETFAVWLDPKSGWKNKYKNWPVALEKLDYVHTLMGEIAGTEPLNTKKKRDGEYTTIEDTVSEWFGLGDILDEKLQEYMTDMNELFIKTENIKRNMRPASKFIKGYAWQLAENVSSWILGSNKNSIKKCLRQWENICRNENLQYKTGEEAKKIIEMSTLLTYHVMESHNRLKH